MFEELNPKQKTKGKLLYLKQTNNILSYIAVFQILKVQYAQENKAYTIQFYNRLKDFIKDEITQADRPTIFSIIAEKALKIN